jgi:hypothetical protein
VKTHPSTNFANRDCDWLPLKGDSPNPDCTRRFQRHLRYPPEFHTALRLDGSTVPCPRTHPGIPGNGHASIHVPPSRIFRPLVFRITCDADATAFRCSSLCANIGLVVQDNTQEGIVDAKSAVVLDDAQLPEFVREKIDPLGALCRSSPPASLAILWEVLLRLVRRAITREQQQGACQPFLAGVKELVDQILLDSDVPCVHIGDESVGELVFGMEDAQQLVFLDHKNGSRRDSGGCTHPEGLTRHASLTERVTETEHCDDGFFAGPIHHRQISLRHSGCTSQSLRRRLTSR